MRFQIRILVLSISLLSVAPCAMSQASWQSTASTGDLTNTDYLGTVSSLNPVHPWANKTSTNGAGTKNGPNLGGTPSWASGPRGYSGAASSAPMQGTYWAPGNIAARQTSL